MDRLSNPGNERGFYESPFCVALPGSIWAWLRAPYQTTTVGRCKTELDGFIESGAHIETGSESFTLPFSLSLSRWLSPLMLMAVEWRSSRSRIAEANALSFGFECRAPS
jgi:hypothetical protein